MVPAESLAGNRKWSKALFVILFRAAQEIGENASKYGRKNRCFR
jgi:hypothetical protein